MNGTMQEGRTVSPPPPPRLGSETVVFIRIAQLMYFFSVPTDALHQGENLHFAPQWRRDEHGERSPMVFHDLPGDQIFQFLQGGWKPLQKIEGDKKKRSWYMVGSGGELICQPVEETPADIRFLPWPLPRHTLLIYHEPVGLHDASLFLSSSTRITPPQPDQLPDGTHWTDIWTPVVNWRRLF